MLLTGFDAPIEGVMYLNRPIREAELLQAIAHLHEPHHTPAFWLRVERAMLDFAQRRAWLAEHGIDVEGI
jgi:hypothetical protein